MSVWARDGFRCSGCAGDDASPHAICPTVSYSQTVTDPRKLDADAAALADAERPLAERLAEYAKLFMVGLGAMVVVGAIIGLIGPSAVPVSIGYTAVVAGAVMLLAGGASGGGYANLGFGLVGRLADGVRRDGGTEDAPPANRSSKKYGVSSRLASRPDPMERLRKGLRPGKNPTAFWTVIAGFLYIAIGSVLVVAV